MNQNQPKLSEIMKVTMGFLERVPTTNIQEAQSLLFCYNKIVELRKEFEEAEKSSDNKKEAKGKKSKDPRKEVPLLDEKEKKKD